MPVISGVDGESRDVPLGIEVVPPSDCTPVIV